jgi:Tol biopolymer transport system component
MFSKARSYCPGKGTVIASMSLLIVLGGMSYRVALGSNGGMGGRGVTAADGPRAVAGTFPGRNGVLVFDAVDRTTQSVQIFQIAAGGTGLKRLTTTTGAVWHEDPTFSANGRTIYIDRYDRASASPSHIYRINANGSGQTLADEVSAPTHVWPSVNGSGSRLAVVQYGNRGDASIATMSANGANRKVIAAATSLQSYGGPAYAPSGGRLAFYRVTYDENGQGVARSDLLVRNGTQNTNITAHSSAQFFGVSWAPNGQTLLAIRGQHTIVSMRPNGTGVRVLRTVSGTETSIFDAVYSPDGTKIAYLQCAGDCGDPDLHGQGSIWVMNADGSGNQRVFNGGSGV